MKALDFYLYDLSRATCDALLSSMTTLSYDFTRLKVVLCNKARVLLIKPPNLR